MFLIHCARNTKEYKILSLTNSSLLCQQGSSSILKLIMEINVNVFNSAYLLLSLSLFISWPHVLRERLIRVIRQGKPTDQGFWNSACYLVQRTHEAIDCMIVTVQALPALADFILTSMLGNRYSHITMLEIRKLSFRLAQGYSWTTMRWQVGPRQSACSVCIINQLRKGTT